MKLQSPLLTAAAVLAFFFAHPDARALDIFARGATVVGWPVK